MQHKCKVTVIRKELFEDLQKEHLADPKSGVCPFYEVGQEFTFERYGGKDDFWPFFRKSSNSVLCSMVSFGFCRLYGTGSILCSGFVHVS